MIWALSVNVKQGLVMAAAGFLLCLIATALAKRHLITVRYALGWMAIGLLVILSSLLTSLVPTVGDFAGMTPTAVLLAGAVGVLVTISIQLSISVSGLQRQLRDAIEREALNHPLGDDKGTEKHGAP